MLIPNSIQPLTEKINISITIEKLFYFCLVKQTEIIVYRRYLQRAAAVVAFLLMVILVQAKAPVLSAEELVTPPPRIIRTCCSFGANLGIAVIPFVKRTDITSIAEIGPHRYLGGNDEGNGNIYTRRGGFIDMGHLRDCADWTAWLYNRIESNYQNSDQNPINLGTEGGAKMLELYLPPSSDSVNTYQLAGKIAYDLSLWHEIATWFGASYVPLLPERYSSFSPEDLYSNLLGVHIAIRALQSDLDYDEAMTVLIAETLDSLECVATEADTYAAMEKVNHLWWTSEKRLPSKNVLLKRYLDVNPELEPWLIPDDEEFPDPCPLSKPDPTLNNDYRLSIRLNHKFPLKAMFLNHSHRTVTQNDFGLLISYIQKELALWDAKNNFRNQKHLLRKSKGKEQIPGTNDKQLLN